MLRELQVTMNKPANTMYKSEEDLVITGMGVVKNEATKTFGFPNAETAKDVFFVDKERVANGVYTSVTDLSDYHDEFTNVKKDEFGKLITYYVGERFAVDQFVSTGLTVGARVSVGVDGKFKKATIPSRFVYTGTVTDNGHTLAVIEVAESAEANA